MEVGEKKLPKAYIDHNQSGTKMDKKEISLVPPPPGCRQCHDRYYKKMEKQEVPPPPPSPPPLGFRRYHNQTSKKMDKKLVSLVPARPPPPPPPPLFSNPLRRKFSKPAPPLLEENARCLLSHPTHPHTLSQRYSKRNIKFDCFSCGIKPSPFSYHNHYFCKTCDVNFHNGCHNFPRKLTHPYHLQHPLTFTFRNYETGFISDGSIDESLCTTVLSYSNKSNPKKFGSIGSDQCTWCGKDIQGNCFYRCSICNFCLDLSCSQNVPLLVLANPKSHHHQLVFYPRPLLTPCDACGVVNVFEPSYACFQCNYMVHQSCINLPRAIKITRHQHRLLHAPYLHSTISPCQICYQPVDIKYGQYDCTQENCSYVVHSKCATHENVWDGEELEWEPEESDEIEDIMPFIKIGSDTIKHFSHAHLLKIEKYDGFRDAEKQCQACILPINSRDFYNCTPCDFFLHEVCAGLLRKLSHALHKHPLILDTSPQYCRNFFIDCSACSRKTSGFRYICANNNCESEKFLIDVRCVLVPDYFTHEIHEHPLFICTSSKGENKIRCKGCKEICRGSYLQCTTCKFSMCYPCATIPTEVCYKYDKHPLSLCYGEEAHDKYWCEICEKELNPTDWFYMCNKCCITIHLDCIFGSSAYMKPGYKFSFGFTIFLFGFSKVEVLRNSSSTRPFCTKCGNRCSGYIYYKKYNADPVKITCSLNCLTKDNDGAKT
ncbi:PREDICTED: uncharacterized protein LOC104789066 [Camelina sativa]|uniref:Uncharacterized protein LOC104789066 n=1 Tax=Camelina sativa TaxID=90675 RepID=A0ABM0ZB78_CAMSA|nr:PREDICTED: uncharacterized protein LOC104789066 [Camelina sativa]